MKKTAAKTLNVFAAVFYPHNQKWNKNKPKMQYFLNKKPKQEIKM